MSTLSREEREELKALSKEVFGVSSKYQRFLDGVQQVVTEEIEEEVPGDDGAEPTTRKVTVPKIRDGKKSMVLKKYTVEETKELLLKFKAQRDQLIADHQAKQAEDKAKAEAAALQKKVQDELAGSSI